MSTVNVIYVNDVKESLVTKKTIKTKNGKTRTFFSVGIPCPLSTNGYGRITLNPVDCIKSTRTEGFRNLRLGEPQKTRKINIFNGEAGRYEDVEVTNEQVREFVLAARKAATAKHKAEVTA